jgi:hypothetical protein
MALCKFMNPSDYHCSEIDHACPVYVKKQEEGCYLYQPGDIAGIEEVK